MLEEMIVLHENCTWEIVSLPHGKTLARCRWVFTIKVGPNEKFDHHKAQLVADTHRSLALIIATLFPL